MAEMCHHTPQNQPLTTAPANAMPLVIRILQHEFPISREYHEGDRLTASEARAMNQLLVENIRNNVHHWVTREARGRGSLTAEEQADLTTRIANYANTYEFRTGSKARPPNPLANAVREIATRYAEAWGRQNGFEPTAPEVLDYRFKLMSSPKIREQAHNTLLHRQSIISKALEDLL